VQLFRHPFFCPGSPPHLLQHVILIAFLHQIPSLSIGYVFCLET
jgi:hypothetical protein